MDFNSEDLSKIFGLTISEMVEVVIPHLIHNKIKEHTGESGKIHFNLKTQKRDVFVRFSESDPGELRTTMRVEMIQLSPAVVSILEHFHFDAMVYNHTRGTWYVVKSSREGIFKLNQLLSLQGDGICYVRIALYNVRVDRGTFHNMSPDIVALLETHNGVPEIDLDPNTDFLSQYPAIYESRDKSLREDPRYKQIRIPGST